MSDITLGDNGPLFWAMLVLFGAWPAILASAAFGAATGALVWTARRRWGCALGGFAGALIGWAVCYWGYLAWADSSLSISVDFPDAILLALERGSPGLLAGAAIGAMAWRRRRGAGAALGALAGFAISAAAGLALR